MADRTLVVFDLDGTIADTAAVDEECFVRAAAATLDLRGMSSDWTAYEHCTDAGILAQACAARHGRPPTPAQLAGFVERFALELQSEYEARPDRFRPVAGADRLLRFLHGSDDHGVAVATGGWGRTARLKLEYAGIPVGGLAFASCDDSHTREEIVQAAIRRAIGSGGRSFGSVVSVGDGVWDVRTAARLGLPFIGRAKKGDADRLRAAGATIIVPGFPEPQRFRSILREAGIPLLPADRPPEVPGQF